ncbi:MAG: riboflavin synthase [Jiangellales bacterium]
MFTGLVEELGEVTAVDDLGDAVRLTVRGDVVTDGATHGDSIAVNGTCLTVVHTAGGEFTADVMAETLHRTSLRGAEPGRRVNLERPLRLSDRLGGHLVQGHVDGTGTVRNRVHTDNWDVVRIDLPAGLRRYVVEKGSIAVDGVSLTVSAVSDDWFEVSLIPTTLSATTLGLVTSDDRVNLEVDVLAKYTERLLDKGER